MPSAPALEAVLFDVDGTLLDTHEFIMAAFEHTCVVHGITFPGRETMAVHVGPPLEQVYAALTGGASSTSFEAAALIATHRGFQKENLHLASAYPGAVETLQWLRDAGLRLGAVTNRSRITSVLTLEQAALAHFFDVVISAEDTPALKPDPAPLRLALAAVGAAPVAAAMVGDTEADVGAARALGLFMVGVSYGFAGASLAAHGPDRLVHHVSEVPGALGVG